MSMQHVSGCALAGGQPARLRREAEGLLATLELWLERHRQRRQLVELGDELLQDVGLSRADAFRESGKWFWEA
ncbi:MAG TPA: DUF1127 domain-containing protein [Geminicoccaceae bacterium]|nr:DUF1127 domain-containing protein [Geminicoccaceae bacterium]